MGVKLLKVFHDFLRKKPKDNWSLTRKPQSSAMWLFKNNDITVGQVAIWNHKNPCQLVAFGINPEFRGKGYSKILMDLTLKQCEILGVKKVTLHTALGNNIAKNLYDKCGFLTKSTSEYSSCFEMTKEI